MNPSKEEKLTWKKTVLWLYEVQLNNNNYCDYHLSDSSYLYLVISELGMGVEGSFITKIITQRCKQHIGAV